MTYLAERIIRWGPRTHRALSVILSERDNIDISIWGFECSRYMRVHMQEAHPDISNMPISIMEVNVTKLHVQSIPLGSAEIVRHNPECIYIFSEEITYKAAYFYNTLKSLGMSVYLVVGTDTRDEINVVFTAPQPMPSATEPLEDLDPPTVDEVTGMVTVHMPEYYIISIKGMDKSAIDKMEFDWNIMVTE